MKKLILSLILLILSLSASAERWALISVSVTDMKKSASYQSETVSQALMGTPVKVMEKVRYWYRIVTPEGYRGWTTEKNLVLLTEEKMSEWRKADRILVTGYFEPVRTSADPSAPVRGNCIMGNILEDGGAAENGCRRIFLPDGSEGYLPEESCVPLKEWMARKDISGEEIVRTAQKFLGFPYLWGGYSPTAMDCSGLCKLSYFLNGIILKRDAKEQILTGEMIDIRNSSYDRLQTGDLLFFGTPGTASAPAKTTHVGMYLENGKFIHSSLIVRINSLYPGKEDSYTSKKIVGATRILGHQDSEEGIISVTHHPWYFETEK